MCFDVGLLASFSTYGTRDHARGMCAGVTHMEVLCILHVTNTRGPQFDHFVSSTSWVPVFHSPPSADPRAQMVLVH